jgi:rhomboid protease GluP
MTTPDSAPSEGRADSFAIYLAKRFVGDKRFQSGVPEEAASLADKSDIVLSYADFGFVIVCIIDRERTSEKRFSFSRQELMDVGRACLKYTGSVNGAKMPVGIRLYEVGNGPPSEADCARLRSFRRTVPGFQKVSITSYYLDTGSRRVWSSAPLGRFLPIGHRKWLQRLLQDPRKKDGEIIVADAVLPKLERRPVATVSLLAILAGIFILEQVAKVGDKGSGLFGLDTPTLFALGAMNSEAVLKGGEWYRILCAALLHADAIHLLLNSVALYLAGVVLESLFGRAWFVALFFVGAVGGSLMGLIVNPPNIVSVGASGAVMGLLAAALVSAMRFPPGPARTQIQVPLLQFLVPSLIPLATERQGGRIDFAAHFGGAILGALAGYALMKMWPKTEERPRFPALAKGLAFLGVSCFGISLFLAEGHYGAYAAEASFSAAGLLVDDSAIPKDATAASDQVEGWGKNHPRDPRVHLFRALHLLEDDKRDAAETELRAALSERQILDRAFGDKKLETTIRTVLCELLVQEGRIDDAKHEARPVCKADEGSTPQALARLGVCD